MKIGLKIDVDTFRGTKYGVPNLCKVLADYSMRASFFFSVGPDNMGRHFWRLLRPRFFLKMFRTKAANLYGWDIFFKGTLWPGPMIGKRLANIIRLASEAGHEIGLHAWDHHKWQAKLEKMDDNAIYESLKKGVEELNRILSQPPDCSAVAGWKCNDKVLTAKNTFSFRYSSDCRGVSIFRPLVDGKEISQPQIPVTLPTYDEVIGRKGISNSNYNEYMLSLLEPGKLNVLTIHAEVEGISCNVMFENFIKMVVAKGWKFVPLGTLLGEFSQTEPVPIVARQIPGRDGWVACQNPVKINY